MSDSELEFAKILLFVPFLVIIVGSVVIVGVVRRGAKIAELRAPRAHGHDRTRHGAR